MCIAETYVKQTCPLEVLIAEIFEKQEGMENNVKKILEEWSVKVYKSFKRFRVGPMAVLLQRGYWTFEFHKRREVSWPVK
jgi:hypothetical protein